MKEPNKSVQLRIETEIRISDLGGKLPRSQMSKNNLASRKQMNFAENIGTYDGRNTFVRMRLDELETQYRHQYRVVSPRR